MSQPALSFIGSASMALLYLHAIVFGGRLPKVPAERSIASLGIDNRPRRDRKQPEPRLAPADAPGDTTAIGAASLPFKEIIFR